MTENVSVKNAEVPEDFSDVIEDQTFDSDSESDSDDSSSEESNSETKASLK